jgi:hypothetical protein
VAIRLHPDRHSRRVRPRDAERSNPPAIGRTITFHYQELTDAGVPRFPTFVRVTK